MYLLDQEEELQGYLNETYGDIVGPLRYKLAPFFCPGGGVTVYGGKMEFVRERTERERDLSFVLNKC